MTIKLSLRLTIYIPLPRVVEMDWKISRRFAANVTKGRKTGKETKR